MDEFPPPTPPHLDPLLSQHFSHHFSREAGPGAQGEAATCTDLPPFLGKGEEFTLKKLGKSSEHMGFMMISMGIKKDPIDGGTVPYKIIFCGDIP
jgi:hypothetical protein